MSETPSIDHAAVQQTLVEKMAAKDVLQTDNSEVRALAAFEGNTQAIRQILTHEAGEDETGETLEEFNAERAALNEAITETAEAHEGVTPTLIRMWIHGEDITTSLEGLGDADTYAEILDSPEATQIIQRIARQLELDIGDSGDAEDRVDGNYGTLTREAVEDIQDALIQAGLLPENMEDGGSNKDGLFGRRTLAALREAVSTEEAEEVVTAAEERLQREASFASIGEGAEAGTAISEEHLDQYGENLASNTFGLFSYDPETNLLTERFGNNTLPLSEVIGSNYADADLPAAEERMMTFAVTQMQTLFNELGVEGDMVDGEIVIQHEGRTLTLNEAIANGGDDPVAYISDWLEDDHEETEIPAEHLTPLINRVQATSGVREVTENNTIVLFDGSEISLENVYAGIEGDITDYTPLENLNIALSEAAEPLTEALEMRFSPDRRNETFFSPAQFNKDDQFVFQLSELQAGELDPNFSGTRHPEAGAILQQALDVMGAAD